MRLYVLAEQLKLKRQIAEAALKAEKLQLQSRKNRELCTEFKNAFADYLEMIAEAGIEYEAYNEPQDSHISFFKGNRGISMDFSGRSSYRFGKDKVFGKWDKDGIIEFLADAFPPGREEEIVGGVHRTHLREVKRAA